MRFSSAILLALPLAAYAAEGEFSDFGNAAAADSSDSGDSSGSMIDQYKSQFQNFLGSFGGKPAADSPELAARREKYLADEVLADSESLSVLTRENWKEMIYTDLPEGTTAPQEWWLFVTGRQTTCSGYCMKAEAAFNETAVNFHAMAETETPNMALLNCDDEPILCNMWGAGPGALWAIDLLPAPLDVDIYQTRLNLSTATPESVAAFLDPAARAEWTLVDSFFHPFNSKLAKLDLAEPAAYAIYYIGKVPSWAFMFILSAFSRTMMTNRMRNHEERRAAAAPAAAN